MATKVLYLPGVLGSALAWRDSVGGPLHPCWVDLPALLSGDLASLQLGLDGVSPGPLALGRTIAVTGLLDPVYTPLALFLRAVGYNVLPLPFDWRLSHFTLGQNLWPVVQAWAAGGPFYVVAHSQGGLVARVIYGQMLQAGAQAQLAGLITIGTPHFGSLEPVRMWWRQPLLYRALAAVAGLAQAWQQGTGLGYLDAVLASHPSWYELQAFAGAGPLFQQFPAQAASIYQLGSYGGANSFLSAGLFQSAQVVQTLLGGWLPAAVTSVIAGVGVQTAFALNPPASPLSDSGWQWTSQGDGTVTLAQASPVGVPVYQVAVEHGLQPLHPAVWALLLTLLPRP